VHNYKGGLRMKTEVTYNELSVNDAKNLDYPITIYDTILYNIGSYNEFTTWLSGKRIESQAEVRMFNLVTAYKNVEDGG
jgi:hypothetical protein